MTFAEEDGWAIISSSRYDEELTLVLVDRSITKSCWWTDTEPHIVMRFSLEEAAKYTCDRLRYGIPHVVPFKRATQILSAQSEWKDKEDGDNDAYPELLEE